ncbi:MAG: hypothetical protein WD226_04055 [Planctomycetota bacterium]
MKATPAALLLFVVGCGALGDPGPPVRAVPWEARATGWLDDPVWYDGLAEVAVYDGTRTIYGLERRFPATIYTNKQRIDPGTTVKAESGGIECFKQHTSERVPTENYDYDFSTATFVTSDGLALVKLTASSQDDCGASFRHLWPRTGVEYRFWESVYFPGTGMRTATIAGPLIAYDALPLVLRDWPSELERATLRVVPSQKHAQRQAFEPRAMTVVNAGEEVLDVPAGAITCRRLLLQADGATLASYWFAVDGSAPWLHALVAHTGPEGVSYRLRSLERRAYWER